MITILSPAKTLDFNRDYKIEKYTEPLFKKEAFQLIKELRRYSPEELSGLMKINQELSELNFFRNMEFDINHNLSNAKQAALTFHGAVYQGLRAEGFNEEQFDYAQEHLRMLSGLYGVLRPLDIIEAYRLEMGIKLKNSRGKNLYDFWRDKITDYFNKEMGSQNNKILVNLASNEYFTAIDIKKFKSNIITPVFKEYKHGTYRIITIYAKRARGLMAKYIIENKIDSCEGLKSFEEEGYAFQEGMSNDRELVFTRNKF
ncbi:peroxide stress protein YaaA [Clostridium sp. YIM B02515]|uniref:UPF0246 protein JK636_13985 n=1 Tax=Clostridium rhizosphaerae TaxID=2803861 RepID=A0ABS1TC34_9CLOT|nr:peroxide stress protein YaaA [Clostridium rhizosphaerae]MBL4936865.1 peroxide stress protein YaaA [Clostridium rhizosphaerae]